MKKIIVALMVTVSFMACNNSPNLTSIESVTEYLAKTKYGITVDKPVLLKVTMLLRNMTETNSSWWNLLNVINTANKYVALDLSGCNIDSPEFNPVSNINTGKDLIVSIVLPNVAQSIMGNFKHFDNLKIVNAKELISIGDSAFSGCTSLTSVSFPAVTSISEFAFSGCTNLTKINIPMATTIANGAFSGCINISRFGKPISITISAVSQNLHNEISDQVRITYYVSDKLKAIHPMPGEIEDLLKEYATYSRGKIQVMIRDPIKTGVAETVERIGIQARQIQAMEQGQAAVVTVFSGIVINYLEQIDVIPFVFSLSTLEYDITSRIRNLIRGRVRQAGIIVGDNPRNVNEEYMYLLNALTQSGYHWRIIAPGLDISDDLPLLLVLGGVEMLNDTALYQIDRYIQTGGKAFFTTKAISIDKEESIEARILNDKGLLAMLSFYGVSIQPEIVMDRSNIMMQYETRTQGGTVQRRIARNAQWIRVLPENGNPNHPISARFNGIDMYWASPMELSDSESLELVSLITTTPSAWSMREPFYTNPDVAAYLFEKDTAETSGVKILGASISGVFPSWFSDKPKPEASIEEELPDMPESPKPARIIVMSDTDFLTSFLSVSGAERNLDFLLQALDWLGNDEDIINIPSRVENSE